MYAQAGDFTDPQNARTITLMAGGLVLLGVGLVVLTVWWWRTSKAEHPALGPLEFMDDRKWRKATQVDQLRLLDGVRPSGAEPVETSSTPPPEIAWPDRAADEAIDFDDLRPGADPLLPVPGPERDSKSETEEEDNG